MSERELIELLHRGDVASWRIRLAKWVESPKAQNGIVAIILLNAVILGMETSDLAMERWGSLLKGLDLFCLGVFICELLAKLIAYRWQFWRNGWNVFDFLVIAVALVPGAGPWSVLRSFMHLSGVASPDGCASAAKSSGCVHTCDPWIIRCHCRYEHLFFTPWGYSRLTFLEMSFRNGLELLELACIHCFR